VIFSPPELGAAQVIATLLPEFAVVGAAGTLGIVLDSAAPLADEDGAELPLAFMASILADTFYPARKKGEVSRSAIVIKQLHESNQFKQLQVLSITLLHDIAVNVPSFCWIYTVYPVIAEPPSAQGASQKIFTSVPKL